jgi:hypothetical protein
MTMTLHGNNSSIYRNFFLCHQNIQSNTLCFWSKLLLSTGETNNHNKELTKNVKHTSKNSHGKEKNANKMEIIF